MTSEPFPEEDRAGTVSFLGLCNVLLRRRSVVLGLPLVAATVVVAVTLVMPRSYTVTASFMPQSGEGQLSRLAGLAAQIGVAVPTGEAGTGPEFYAELLRTRALLRAAVQTEYGGQERAGDAADDFPADLVTLLGIEEEEPAKAVERAIEELRGRLHMTTNAETGVVQFSVATRRPWLSEGLARRILELVNEFDLETRQSQALAEREFLDERMAEAQRDLLAAEDSLKRFLERNRRYENSPDLRFEYERLQRRVDLQQQLYATLSQSFEQAKIEAVRNIPVITVVEPPARPARPDSRRLGLKVVLALLVGGMLGILWAFGMELVEESRRENPDEYGEFSRLRREARDDLRNVTEPVRGVFRRRGTN